MRWLRIILVGTVVMWNSLTLVLAAEPEVTAQAAILVEASTGRVLYEKNADMQEYPASMTKMLTCLLALENGNLDSTVVVSPTAAATEDSELGLEAGDAIRLSELLTGMMLESDNAAAVAVAEHLAPSIPAFAEQMNAKARELGARQTHFMNPNGLPDADHYSTARDMMRIARYAMRNSLFRRIVGTESQRIQWQSPAGKYFDAVNTNELLDSGTGIIGIKTGWTRAAGGCLAAAAQRGNVTLIAIVMDAADADVRFSDAAALLNYGFPRVRMTAGPVKEKLGRSLWVHDGKTYKVSAHPAQDVQYAIFDGEDAKHYSLRYDVPRFMNAPIQGGQKVGDLVVLYDGKEVNRIDMLADSAIGRGFSLMSFMVGLYDRILGPFFG